MPIWVNNGVDEYLKRIPKHAFDVKLLDIKLSNRNQNTNASQLDTQKLLKTHPKDHKLIMLERTGKLISTENLAAKMQEWQEQTQSVSIAIGGPEGFSYDDLKLANETWSLSGLTMAHPIVRVVLAEQLYRAYSILINHPYHRGEEHQR